MRKLSICVLLCTLLTATPLLRGQSLLWNVSMDWTFDNREYNSEFNQSQTLFGAHIDPTIGVGWEEGHGIMGGAQVLAEFGAPVSKLKVAPIFYYNYNHKGFKASLGIFERKKVIGSDSRAFFSDSIRFFSPLIQGVLLQYERKQGYVEFFCDWDGRQSDTRREMFTLYSSGKYQWRWLFGRYELSAHHFAGTTQHEGVVDNIWVSPHVGADLSHRLWLDSLTVSVGWLAAFQNDRSQGAGYLNPSGAVINARIEKYKVGIFNSLYVGDNLMPLFARYGYDLYWGDSFHSTTKGLYNRLEIYWNPLQRQNLNLRISSVHHYDGMGWSWQQLITFSVGIGNETFRKKTPEKPLLSSQ